MITNYEMAVERAAMKEEFRNVSKIVMSALAAGEFDRARYAALRGWLCAYTLLATCIGGVKDLIALLSGSSTIFLNMGMQM